MTDPNSNSLNPLKSISKENPDSLLDSRQSDREADCDYQDHVRVVSNQVQTHSPYTANGPKVNSRKHRFIFSLLYGLFSVDSVSFSLCIFGVIHCSVIPRTMFFSSPLYLCLMFKKLCRSMMGNGVLHQCLLCCCCWFFLLPYRLFLSCLVQLLSLTVHRGFTFLYISCSSGVRLMRVVRAVFVLGVE